jgi:tetratricopeptide (TPR) repeat protein
VVRVSDGRVTAGHAISTDAYAAFFRGRIHELEGAPRLAIRDYEAAIAADPMAGEAWSRLGALHCTQAPEAAEHAFEQAESIDSHSVAYLHARSLCATAQSRTELAQATAERALESAPDNPEISRLVISTNLDLGRKQRASALAWAHTSQYPTDSEGWLLLLACLPAERRTHLEAEAATRTLDRGSLPPLTHSAAGAALSRRPRSEQDLVDALYDRDHDRAARAARELQLTTLRLARRAMQAGAFEFAYTEFRRGLEIDPSHAEAWVLSLVLADLLDRSEDFDHLLAAPPSNLRTDAPETAAAWSALLQRRLGVAQATSTVDAKATEIGSK